MQDLKVKAALAQVARRGSVKASSVKNQCFGMGTHCGGVMPHGFLFRARSSTAWGLDAATYSVVRAGVLEGPKLRRLVERVYSILRASHCV